MAKSVTVNPACAGMIRPAVADVVNPARAGLTRPQGILSGGGWWSLVLLGSGGGAGGGPVSAVGSARTLPQFCHTLLGWEIRYRVD